MRTYWLFTAILAIIAITCLSGVQGQISTPSSVVTANAASQYAQYYTMPTASAPITHISAPAQTAIVGKTPATLYLGTQQQSMPYAQYLASANNAVVPSLWIQGARSWTQYVVVPQGATVTLIAISPTGGSGYLSEVLNGTTYNSNSYFYPNSVLTFYADAVGQHTLSISIKGQSSNQVTINVIAYVPPKNYPTLYNYMTPYNYPTFWYSPPTYYHSGHHLGGHIGHGNRGHHAGVHHK